MIGQIAPVWFASVERLNAPFPQVTPPARPRIILGHGGGDDAFGTPPDVIAFDLSALVTAYADRGEAAFEALVSRLLFHEYTHLLAIPFLNRLGWTEAWAEARPYRWALRCCTTKASATCAPSRATRAGPRRPASPPIGRVRR
jgi:hypothetical protein